MNRYAINLDCKHYVIVHAPNEATLLEKVSHPSELEPCFAASGSPGFRDKKSMELTREFAKQKKCPIVKYSKALPSVSQNSFLVAFKAARAAGKIKACSFLKLADESPLSGAISVAQDGTVKEVPSADQNEHHVPSLPTNHGKSVR